MTRSNKASMELDQQAIITEEGLQALLDTLPSQLRAAPHYGNRRGLLGRLRRHEEAAGHCS
jgi:hypothetical protein